MDSRFRLVPRTLAGSADLGESSADLGEYSAVWGPGSANGLPETSKTGSDLK